MQKLMALSFVGFLLMHGGSGAAIARSGPAGAVNDLLSVYGALDEMCRGRSDVEEACDARTKAGRALYKLGYCLGKEGQGTSESTWHRCTRNSLRHYAK